jgi:hypothetical protein
VVGTKRNSNGRMIVITIGVIMVGFSVLFQNCSPTNISTDTEELFSDANSPGDSSYRLPAGFNETLASGVTCQVATNAATVGTGETLTYTFTTTGNLPSGYRVYPYGTKNGIPDASEVVSGYYSTLTQSFVNPGYIGGNYTRYFQMRDRAGRVLCQTNTVAITLAGNSCSLSTTTPILNNGYQMVLNTNYAVGTPAPESNKYVFFNGTNNGITIAATPYDQPNLNTYTRVMTAGDAGNDYVRNVTVLNPADSSIFCQTNSVRVTVLR